MSDRYFARLRQDWIAETLRIFGFINRAHLRRKFGISEPQASTDLQAFLATNPEAAVYDARSKSYRVPTFGKWTAPRRCSTSPSVVHPEDGSCLHCSADNAEDCRDPRPAL